MRIAFLTHEPLYPPSGGGSAEAVYLVQEFIARGHEVHVFCPKLDDSRTVAERFKVVIHEFSTWKMGRYTRGRNLKYLAYPAFLQRLVERAAASTPFDLVFSQHAIAAVTAGRLKRSLRIPVVMNFLDYLTGFMETWPSYLAPPPLLKLLKAFELSMPRRYGVDAILTVSDTLADYFVEAGYPRTRILPIYYGYDSQLFTFRGEQAFVAAENPVVVMHGSLDHHHLRTIALEAFAHVAAERPDVRFRIVGHHTDALNAFMALARSRIPVSRFELPGFLPYSKVAAQLASATVGVVPYEESVGTHCAFVAKIVEYLGVGLPVASTRLNSATRYFGSEPMVRFTDFTGTEFAKAILVWLNRAPISYAEPARQASSRVARELDWGAIASRAVRFVERVVAREVPEREPPV